MRTLVLRDTVKSILGRNPFAYKAAATVYENALYLPHIARQHLGPALFGIRQQESGAGAQSVLTWTPPAPRWNGAADLIGWLRSRDVQVKEGGHTFYLAPQPALRHLMPWIVDAYPERCGFKILKDCRHPDEARYLYKHRHTLRFLARLMGTPHDQLAPANYMWRLGIGPRVWDLACWESGGARCTVFVVDHVDGEAPTADQCQSFLTRLADVNRNSRLRVLIPEWESNPDFAPPDCNRNLVQSTALGRPQYVDFQNFGLTTRERTDGADVDRTAALVGSTLARGAKWAVVCCASERADAIEESLLLAGATRFSIVSGACRREDVDAAVPMSRRGHLKEAVVFAGPSGAAHAVYFDA